MVHNFGRKIVQITEILTAIAQLADSDENKVQCQQLAAALRDQWIESFAV
ncbi:hypothetical protein [Nostoc sp.]